VGLDGSYQFSFPDELAAHLSYIQVKEKGAKLVVKAPTTDGSHTIYEVDTTSGEANFKVLAVFTEVLEPYPRQITQMETQLVKFVDHHYVTTPYSTDTQKTTVKLASTIVESYTRKEPNSQRGAVITYGPYNNIEPFTPSPMTIHYANNKPFAKLSYAHREIEVSHWGNVAVEETYEVKHSGAELKGGFSRFDYQMSRAQESPSFTKLVALLPLEAHNIYYRDQIGNISTSDISVEDGYLQMDVATRFPMFGGWKTEFYIGYSVPTELVLFVDENDRYSLQFDFHTIFENVWVDELEIKVILPEGSTDIEASIPYPILDRTDGKRFTYFDSQLNGGRNVITIRAQNIVEEHDEQIVISYSFNKTRMLVEPGMVVAFFFCLFVCFSFINIFSSKIGKDKPHTA
jgi:oligosaccharyltransferase complex subunit alpha (ribophorin I)